MQRTWYGDLLAGDCLLLVPERELLDELLPGQHRLPVPAAQHGLYSVTTSQSIKDKRFLKFMSMSSKLVCLSWTKF